MKNVNVSADGCFSLELEPHEFYAFTTFLVRVASDAVKYRGDKLCERPSDKRNYRTAVMMMDKLQIPESEVTDEVE